MDIVICAVLPRGLDDTNPTPRCRVFRGRRPRSTLHHARCPPLRERVDTAAPLYHRRRSEPRPRSAARPPPLALSIAALAAGVRRPRRVPYRPPLRRGYAP